MLLHVAFRAKIAASQSPGPCQLPTICSCCAVGATGRARAFEAETEVAASAVQKILEEAEESLQAPRRAVIGGSSFGGGAAGEHAQSERGE